HAHRPLTDLEDRRVRREAQDLIPRPPPHAAVAVAPHSAPLRDFRHASKLRAGCQPTGDWDHIPARRLRSLITRRPRGTDDVRDAMGPGSYRGDLPAASRCVVQHTAHYAAGSGARCQLPTARRLELAA